MKITVFDRATLRMLTAEIEAAVQPIAEKYGLTLEMAGGRFDAAEWTEKVRMKIADSPIAKARNESAASLLDLPPDIVGKVFQSRGRSFKVTGINLNRPKYPVSAERIPDGKRFKFPPRMVKTAS